MRASGSGRAAGHRGRGGGAAVVLSTVSAYPESTAAAFEIAARLGYDGLEIMVGPDPLSQDTDALRRLSEYHRLPVVSVHAPCLLITQRVWGGEPWGKLERSGRMARELGAGVVVVHPPFRWQRDYAADFVAGVARLEDKSGVGFAVENMYPWRAGGQRLQAYLPGWDPRDAPYEQVTLDLSHAATAGVDGLELARDLGGRLTHLHLADGSGSGRDEHLPPGRGGQPCAEVLQLLAGRGYDGAVVVEVSTRRAVSRDDRERELARCLAFAREQLAPPPRAAYAVTVDGRIDRV